MIIDPDLKYCPQCNDEYRAEIEKCAACGLALLTGRQRLAMEEERRRRCEGKSVELAATDELVNIRQGSLADMKHLEKVLRAESIAALIAGDENSCGKGCCGSNFYLKVRLTEAQDAMAVLEAEFRRATGLAQHDLSHAGNIFNPQAGEAICPACGFIFPTTTTTCPDCGLCLG